VIALYKLSCWYFSSPVQENRKPLISPALSIQDSIDCTKTGLINELVKTWNRPVDKLAVAVDLPRLANKTKIFGEDGALVLDGTKFNEEPSPHVLVRAIILCLCTLTGYSRTAIDEQFEPVMNPVGDISSRLQFFFQNHFNVGPVVGILKASNQSILAAPVIRMKVEFGSEFPYKDQRGKWSVENLIFENSVQVIHTKWEMSWERPEKYDAEHFDFEWRLVLTFDKDVSQLMDADLSITQLVFASSVPQHFRTKVLEKLQQSKCISNISV